MIFNKKPMNTKQKLKEIILNYKDNKPFDVVINQMLSLYFEVEEQEKKESPFEGSQVKETKNDLITEQSLLDLGFEHVEYNWYKKIIRSNNNLHLFVDIHTIRITCKITQSSSLYESILYLSKETTINQFANLIKVLSLN